MGGKTQSPASGALREHFLTPSKKCQILSGPTVSQFGVQLRQTGGWRVFRPELTGYSRCEETHSKPNAVSGAISVSCLLFATKSFDRVPEKEW